MEHLKHFKGAEAGTELRDAFFRDWAEKAAWLILNREVQAANLLSWWNSWAGLIKTPSLHRHLFWQCQVLEPCIHLLSHPQKKNAGAADFSRCPGFQFSAPAEPEKPFCQGFGQ